MSARLDDWWKLYGPFSPSPNVQGYPDAREVFVAYYRRSGMSRMELANRLNIQEKMVYHIERYGKSLDSVTRLRQLCVLLAIPAILFSLAECPKVSSGWWADGYDWPAGDYGFPAPGAVIRHFRQLRDWHQRDLAEALSVSEVVVRQWENKNKNIDSVTRRQAIASVLGIPVAARVWLGLDTLHVPLPSAPATLSANVPHLSLEEIHSVQGQLWAGYYAGASQDTSIVQANETVDKISNILPFMGAAERSQWLEAQSLLLQWLVNATRDTGDPRVVLGKAKRALEIAEQSGIPDLVATARMRQMETAYVLGKEDLAIAYGHILSSTSALDLVVDATRAVACARVLACAAQDKEDRCQVLGLLDQSLHFGGTEYGLHYDEPTYLLRHAESLLNLARLAPDRATLLRQAASILDQIHEPVARLRLVGLRTTQAQIAVGIGEFEQAATWANEAIEIGNEIALRTHLRSLITVYYALRESAYRSEPLTAKLGLSLLQRNRF